MLKKRSCPTTLDKPILLFGLEAEDVALLACAVGGGSLIMGPLYPGILGILAWFTLIHFKKDKPEAYILHLLYEKGLSLPGLIKPVKQGDTYACF